MHCLETVFQKRTYPSRLEETNVILSREWDNDVIGLSCPIYCDKYCKEEGVDVENDEFDEPVENCVRDSETDSFQCASDDNTAAWDKATL